MRNIAANNIYTKPFGRRVYTYTKIIRTNLREVWCSIALGVHCTNSKISQIRSACFTTAPDAGTFCYNLVHTFYWMSLTYPEDVRGSPKLCASFGASRTSSETGGFVLAPRHEYEICTDLRAYRGLLNSTSRDRGQIRVRSSY